MSKVCEYCPTCQGTGMITKAPVKKSVVSEKSRLAVSKALAEKKLDTVTKKIGRIVPFGKYKGKTVREIVAADSNYARWFIKACNTHPKLTRQFEQAIFEAEEGLKVYSDDSGDEL